MPFDSDSLSSHSLIVSSHLFLHIHGITTIRSILLSYVHHLLTFKLLIIQIFARWMGTDDWHRLPRSYCSPHVPAVSAHITEPLSQTALSWLWFSSTFRLAFVTLRNNLMVLSLRAMIVQFVVLMLIAAFCFGGFLYALWTWVINTYNLGTGKLADTIGTRRLSRNEAGYVICISLFE